MKKYLGNIVSWSSCLIVILAISTFNIRLIFFSILIATIMDMFDGKLARKYGDNTKYAHIFGEITDSLCDSFNFGFVPALIMPLLIFKHSSILLVISIFFYIFAGIYRLARFSAEKDGSISVYKGIPITVVGPMLALCTLIFSKIIVTIFFNFLFGFLMISTFTVRKIKF